jgi:hypothetical protein
MDHKIMLGYLKARRRARWTASEWPFRLAVVIVAAAMLMRIVWR